MNTITVRKDQELILPIIWQGKETELATEIILAEPGASVTVLGLLLGKQKDSLTIATNVTHAAPQTTSNLVLHGAVTDTAQINFEGLIKINHGAKGTIAKMAAHILLLSDHAKGRAIPSLEILENDVKAGHAATVGKVSDLEMFYLQSRGLTKRKAKELIIEGFLKRIIQQLPEKESAIATKALADFYKN